MMIIKIISCFLSIQRHWKRTQSTIAQIATLQNKVDWMI
jgi:hypothetical protein